MKTVSSPHHRSLLFLPRLELILLSGEVLWKSDEIERSDNEEEDSDGSNPPELVEYDEEEEEDDESEGEEEEEEMEEGEGDDDDEGWEDCSEGEEGEGESHANEEEGEEEGDQDDWESCSDDGEEEEEGEEPPELVAVQPRVRLDQQRILTAEDFSLLEKLKSAQRERLSDPRNRSKRKRLDDDEDEEGARPSQSYAVSEEQIAPEAKVKKATKVERLTRVLEGRVENRFVHDGHAGGLTNKEKQRKKNYVMIRKGKREVATKNRRSNSEVRWQKSKAVSFLLTILFLSLTLTSGCRKSNSEETEESAEEHRVAMMSRLLCRVDLPVVTDDKARTYGRDELVTLTNHPREMCPHTATPMRLVGVTVVMCVQVHQPTIQNGRNGNEENVRVVSAEYCQ
jgi:hypothetical protein